MSPTEEWQTTATSTLELSADGADQATDKAADLVPARPLAGPQHGGHKAPLAVKDDDRLAAVIAVIVMKGIE